jgi:predicted homoserine dehydrogenase-like protein
MNGNTAYIALRKPYHIVLLKVSITVTKATLIKEFSWS